MTHRRWSQPDPRAKLHSTAENTGFSVLNYLRNVIWCTLNYIPEPIKHTKLVFSAILLSFGRGSGWDELLYVITKLPASFRRPIPRFDPLCVGACNIKPPLGLAHLSLTVWRMVIRRNRDSQSQARLMFVNCSQNGQLGLYQHQWAL